MVKTPTKPLGFQEFVAVPPDADYRLPDFTKKQRGRQVCGKVAEMSIVGVVAELAALIYGAKTILSSKRSHQ
ncbi:MAG: hypothetical protein KME12_01550 [Trichocoleus desertorum ATA4-8-CV12]|jgi:hypothetical protein|nr:hypothetical protein [Trichocoleus desertorum ATA4-8-CV12]